MIQIKILDFQKLLLKDQKKYKKLKNMKHQKNQKLKKDILNVYFYILS